MAIDIGPSGPPPSSLGEDSNDLASLGYDQELHRSLGPFASFAAGFSFVSILTTVFQLFAFGFSMARDGRLPFSKQLAHVSPRRGTPALPNIVVGGLAIALLVVNLGQSALFTDITGVAVVVVYLAYLGVTVPRLVSRLRPGFAEREQASGEQFSLGRLGLPLNIIAVVFGAFFLVDIGWPRAIVYGTTGYLHYFSLIFVGGCAALGIISYLRVRSATVRL